MHSTTKMPLFLQSVCIFQQMTVWLFLVNFSQFIWKITWNTELMSNLRCFGISWKKPHIFLETPAMFPNLYPFKFAMNIIIDNSPNKRDSLSRWDLNPVSIQQLTFCRCSPPSTLGSKSASREDDSNYVVGNVSLGLCQYGKLTVISLN